jgi:hypothetical protein
MINLELLRKSGGLIRSGQLPDDHLHMYQNFRPLIRSLSFFGSAITDLKCLFCVCRRRPEQAAPLVRCSRCVSCSGEIPMLLAQRCIMT